MNKSKQKLSLEYPLATKSPNIIWEQISTAHGMERWLADHVEESEDGIISLTWGNRWTDHHTLEAKVLERQKNSFRRMKRGTRFFITRIRATGPDGVTREISPMEVIVN